MTPQAMLELQARRARMQAEVASLHADSDKVTANIDHVIGPDHVVSPGLDMGGLLALLAGRTGGRTIVIVEAGV